ncbi:MAG: class A beta-lactamase [Janthinobacterium lividum]
MGDRGGMATRRGVLGGACVLLASARGAQGDGGDAIAAIERRRGGRLGVFAVDAGTGAVLAHRADERFMLCSTFKGVLAGLVLWRVDAGRDALDERVAYGRGDLLPASPVTEAHVAEGAMSVGALCAAILAVSDNAAANLLLARVGGPAALTAFARRLGDGVTRFDRYELAAGERSGVLDTTTPRAIAGLARSLVLGDVLAEASRARLEAWMAACTVGGTRLRAAFPAGWGVRDRTGTADGRCNDYAVVRRPGRAPLVVAAYHDAPGMELEAQEAVLREAGAAVVAWAEGDRR